MYISFRAPPGRPQDHLQDVEREEQVHSSLTVIILTAPINTCVHIQLNVSFIRYVFINYYHDCYNYD